VIKYRFPQEQIEELLALKIYDLDEKQVLKMREYLQTDDIDALTIYIENLRDK
ncbi:TPA: antibiotic acetyltransferase, partial [Acinetobacter nosocomialis]